MVFNCTSLTDIAIPGSVTNLGNFAFYYCTNLVAITVDTNNPVYSSVGGVLFDKDRTRLIVCPGGAVGYYTAPNTVTNIGNYAFAYCSSLTNIIIPDSVTSIAPGAFYYCNHLTGVTLGSSVASIGYEAFDGCRSLAAITVDPSNPDFSSVDGVLFDQSLSTLIVCPMGKAGSYAIPSGVASIGFEAFWACTGLTNVTIPNSVTNIGNFAFYLAPA